jgi:hypothetical protein
LLLAATPALMGAKCGESLVKDPGFELWCGETLCAWKVEEGQILKTATWHERDHGVELLGSAVHLSQRAEVVSERPDCLQFDLLANVAADTQVVLEMDFGDDGSAEFTQVLPTRPWSTLAYKTRAPSWYRVIKFSIRKRGAGHAVLARIRVGAETGCEGPPLSTANRPGGAACESAAQCRDGMCTPEGKDETIALYPPDPRATLCAACTADEHCQGSETCGLAIDDVRAYRRCLPAGGQHLGERCATDRQCSTGICCEGVCSECCPGRAACAGTRGCARAEVKAALPPRRPWRCDAGLGTGPAGAWCLAAADCTSGACESEGSLSVCAGDGKTCDEARRCRDWGADLPNACTLLGAAGGRCR